MFARHLALSLLIAGTTLSAVNSARADTGWSRRHPRRDQVNDRLENQNRRIHNEVREGEITRTQAAQLHQQDWQIRQEERSMAAFNGGDITRTEQRALNQQENQVSREIGL